MLETIRIALFKKNLRQWLSAHKRTHTTHTLDSAKQISILFDATDPVYRQEMLKVAKNLEKNGKKVHILGYFHQKQVSETPDFNFFTLKENNFSYQPNSEKATQFAAEKSDLLLVFNPAQLAPLAWVAAHTSANMKIGPASDMPHDLDLQLETPKGKGPAYFVEQLQIYLSTIVLHKK
jgi:hypothetical protein